MRASDAFGATYLNSGKTMSLYVAGKESFFALGAEMFAVAVALSAETEFSACTVDCAFWTGSVFCSAVLAQAMSDAVAVKAKME